MTHTDDLSSYVNATNGRYCRPWSEVKKEREYRMDSFYRSLPRKRVPNHKQGGWGWLWTIGLVLVLLALMVPFMKYYSARLDAMLGQIPAKMEGR